MIKYIAAEPARYVSARYVDTFIGIFTGGIEGVLGSWPMLLQLADLLAGF
jgi:hypothetical protein